MLLSTLAITFDEPSIWLNIKSTEYNSWTVTVDPADSVVKTSFLINDNSVADTLYIVNTPLLGLWEAPLTLIFCFLVNPKLIKLILPSFEIISLNDSV